MFQNTRKLIQLLLMIFILTQHAILLAATTSDMTNLQDVNYPSKKVITETIKQIYQNANKSDAYSLSLPLIAASQQGIPATYATVLHAITTPVNGLSNDAFKAWILGRVLFAAKNMDDKTTIAQFLPQAQDIISDFKQSNAADPEYAYYAWACGYLAALNHTQYQRMLKPMVDSAQNLSKVYFQTSSQDALSNAMWAWVMAVQAAANAHDTATYRFILNQIMLLGRQTTIAAALKTSLIRTDSSSDYPAWAISIVQLAAAIMDDRAIYQELCSIELQEIQHATAWQQQTGQSTANQWKAQAEISLVHLNVQLAEIHYLTHKSKESI